MSPFTHTWPVSTSCRYGKRGREDTEIISVESSVTSISYAFSREINYSSPRKYELSLRNPAPIHPRSFFFFSSLRLSRVTPADTLLPIFFSRALSPRAIARLRQFDTRAIDIVCHEIRRPTGVLELHLGDGGKEWKGRTLWSAILLVRQRLYTDS